MPAVAGLLALGGDEDLDRELRARHSAQGLHLNARTAHSDWLGERLDLGWAIDVLHPKANRVAARDST